MAAGFVVTSGKMTLTASATKSIWLLNPVTNKAYIWGIDISMDNSTAVTGVQIDLYRVVTIGSAAGTSATANPLDPGTQVATTTALVALSTEPTTVTVLASWEVQPLGGLLPMQLPLGREIIAAQAGARVGLRYTTASGVTPDLISNVWLDE